VNDLLTLVLALVLLMVVIGTFVRICVKLRRGGGSL
jgi:hypothetical protein